MNDKELALAIAKKPLFHETIINEIFQILAEQKFVDDGEPAGSDDIETVEMNNLEKALSTASRNCESEARELVCRLNGETEKPFANAEEEHEARMILAQLKEKYSSIQNMLWHTIRVRLHEKLKNPEVGGFAIRQGFKIAITPKKRRIICRGDREFYSSSIVFIGL